ncbi:hypothetical protein CDCA_CDCA13G3741 [Cyanidium caldarium]|uniref:Uncharacterized protein n=1 Tax=Cyanidium caldarium TaxID=2771 RepID=A0AAV9J0A2_CYACA|nr:hypothetical protein CDCA_CDCA13G3741 [Cyanidium caldarium]
MVGHTSSSPMRLAFTSFALPRPSAGAPARTRTPHPPLHSYSLLRRAASPATLSMRTGNKRMRWTTLGAGLLIGVFGLSTLLPLVDSLREPDSALSSPSGGGQERRASLGSKLSNDEIANKLRSVPVFSVTDATGRPILSENTAGRQPFPGDALGARGLADANEASDDSVRPGRRLGLFFLDYADAENYRGIVQKRAAELDMEALREIRVVSIPLEDALAFVPVPEGGRGQQPDPDDEFHLSPSSASMRFADEVMRASDDPLANATYSGGVPVFVIRGLALVKQTVRADGSTAPAPNGDQIVPLFFDPDDLQVAWQRLRQTGQRDTAQLPEKLPLQRVEVSDLTLVLKRLRQGDPELRPLSFFPSRRSVERAVELGNRDSAAAVPTMPPG